MKPKHQSSWPTREDYDYAMRQHATNLTIQALQRGHLAVNKAGFISRYGGAGLYTSSYRIHDTLVRCFCSNPPVEPPTDIRERYQAIETFIQKQQDHVSALVPIKYYPQGIDVFGKLFPVVTMPFLRKMMTLGNFLDKQHGNPRVMHALAQAWLLMIREMEAAQMAHGDLDLTNVLVKKCRRQVILKLVDYDIMWIPPLSHLTQTAEAGHEHFQHPAFLPPNERPYDQYMDRFSSLVIYLSIKALIASPALYAEVIPESQYLLLLRSDYNQPDLPNGRIARLHAIPGIGPYIDELATSLKERRMPHSVLELDHQSSESSTPSIIHTVEELPSLRPARPYIPSAPIRPSAPPVKSQIPVGQKNAAATRFRTLFLIIAIVIAIIIIILAAISSSAHAATLAFTSQPTDSCIFASKAAKAVPEVTFCGPQYGTKFQGPNGGGIEIAWQNLDPNGKLFLVRTDAHDSVPSSCSDPKCIDLSNAVNITTGKTGIAIIRPQFKNLDLNYFRYELVWRFVGSNGKLQTIPSKNSFTFITRNVPCLEMRSHTSHTTINVMSSPDSSIVDQSSAINDHLCQTNTVGSTLKGFNWVPGTQVAIHFVCKTGNCPSDRNAPVQTDGTFSLMLNSKQLYTTQTITAQFGEFTLNSPISPILSAKISVYAPIPLPELRSLTLTYAALSAMGVSFLLFLFFQFQSRRDLSGNRPTPHS